GETVVVERDGEDLALAVEPGRTCRQGVIAVDAPGIVAIPYDGNIVVTLRLLEVATDDQVAFSVAHVLAADLLNVDFSRDDISWPEPRTTQRAVELTARAGFSVENVEALLQLQAMEQPWMVMGPRPMEVRVGEIPRRIIALRMVRTSASRKTGADP
ncbi:MAG: hypothetical protein ACRDKE_07395, partial [Solirubrobacterales bacterium]